MTTSPDPQSFDAFPAVYDRFKQLAGGQVLQRLADVLPDRGVQAVDLGAGTGYYTEALADRYEHVLAVDISEPMLAYARQHHTRPNITYARRDLHNVRPSTGKPSTLVFSAYVLHHVPDLTAALAHCRDLVAPGGLAVLIDAVADPKLIGEDGRLPRSYFEAEAERGYQRDLETGRPPEEAAELRALKLHPAWLRHLESDRLPTPQQFAECYQAVFPGAEITDLYRAKMLVWKAGTRRLRPYKRDPHAIA